VSTVLPILPVTKFRVPRLREGTVARAALVQRIDESTRVNPVTVVCAPGGSGKTTLLSQLAADVRAAGDACVWIAIDEEDDDANRLFATLVQALEPLELAWEVPPRELAAGVIGAGAQTRAALAAAVNALCTSVAPRIVLVFDDFHRITRPDVSLLVESLVERLPDHVAVVIGTRTEPALPLARWRGHGEVGEFTLADLRFTESEALELAGLDHQDGGEATERSVIEALERTQGWAVGLSMLLHAGSAAPAIARGRARALAARGEVGQRKLFAYLAQEVLDRLPQPLQAFALRCSILAELTPELCAAVTLDEDAATLLDELYRCDLFLTVVDEAGPVLRFHDLFREFLEAELARRLPDEVRTLHERAARAEATSARAIHHFLAGELWEEALWLILRVGESLVTAGAIATLERWIDQVPEPVRRGDPHVSYLRGCCAWLRWDWARACRELAPAIAGLKTTLEAQSRVRAYFMLIDALTSSGAVEEAWQRLDELATLPLDDLGQAEHALLRAWCRAAEGRPADVTGHMRSFVELAERQPQRVCPVTAGRIHCLLIGLPGIDEVFDRFVAASRQVMVEGHAPWQLAALAVEGWVHLWRGDAALAQATIDRADVLYQQFGGIRLIGERLGQLRAMHAAARGRHEESLAIARRHADGMRAPELAPHRAVWLRAYQHGLARMLWMAGRDAEYLEMVPALTAPRTGQEWGWVEVAADVARGHAALLRGQPREALAPLERACAEYERHCLPSVYCDPRVALAAARTALRDRQGTWRAFEPLYRGAVERGEFGPLLLDSRRHLLMVLDGLAPDLREAPATLRLRERLQAWSKGPAGAQGARLDGPLARLSEREREVLAAVADGAGNKHIARALDLSLHTVKRHIANILDKLDCASRGQAAEIYRRAAPR
jgi:LuxR family maltose regulon positive regulatory protein